MPTRQYVRSRYAHWCVDHDFFIALDAQQDCYLSIPLPKIQPLLPFLTEGTANSYSVPVEFESLAEELVAASLLVNADSASSPEAFPSRPQPPRPGRLLYRSEPAIALSQLARLFPVFLQACSRAHFYLRHHSLQQIVDRTLRRRKNSSPSRPCLSEGSVTFLASAYHKMRPLYPHDYVCLFDSFCLLEFLAHWAFLPSWVFGVSADPFRAHCWVQHSDLVLCDTSDFSSTTYAPIMWL